GQLVVLASGYAEDDDALPIRTEARLVAGTLRAGESVEYTLGAERKGYLVPATGRIRVNGVEADARDGIAIAEVETITITAIEEAEVVLVDTL
ncbi:pirin family protein, partial [Novosphingobium nitrogenifigens]